MSTSVLSGDPLRLVIFQIQDFATLTNASQVCRTWRRIVKQVLPELIEQLRFPHVSFKITRVRFLLEKLDNDRYFNLHNCKFIDILLHRMPFLMVVICSNLKKIPVKLPLHMVSEDERYYVFESPNCPPAWKLKSLSYEIQWSNDGIAWQPFRSRDTNYEISETGRHYPDADLSWQMFGTGLRYQKPDDQVMIGSAGGFNSFHCCCAIQLLPE